MYTLRTITEKKVVSNTFLGDDYKVYHSDHHTFKELLAYVNPEYQAQVKVIILYNNSTKNIPIFQQNENYIMTESGKTFERL